MKLDLRDPAKGIGYLCVLSVRFMEKHPSDYDRLANWWKECAELHPTAKRQCLAASRYAKNEALFRRAKSKGGQES